MSKIKAPILMIGVMFAAVFLAACGDSDSSKADATRTANLEVVGRFIEELEGNQRVALIASGAISLEVGGPRVGQTDEEWVSTVGGLLEQGNYGSLAKSATAQRMYAAGNVSGELLCWITVTGALGEKRPLFVETDRGSGYAAWKLE